MNLGIKCVPKDVTKGTSKKCAHYASSKSTDGPVHGNQGHIHHDS